MPSYLECTFLAALFATEYRMSWLAEPTVVYRVGSPLAESRSRAYVVGQAGALQQILRLDLPSQVRRGLRRRVTGSYHFAAEYDRKGGRLADAWRWHGKSLLNLGGWRYLLYTRHLLYSRTSRFE